MVYNLGWPRFSKFRKLRAALEVGDYRRAADEMVDSAWYGQAGNRSKRLVGMMHHDSWPEA
jgi:lysozyme